MLPHSRHLHPHRLRNPPALAAAAAAADPRQSIDAHLFIGKRGADPSLQVAEMQRVGWAPSRAEPAHFVDRELQSVCAVGHHPRAVLERVRLVGARGVVADVGGDAGDVGRGLAGADGACGEGRVGEVAGAAAREGRVGWEGLDREEGEEREEFEEEY